MYNSKGLQLSKWILQSFPFPFLKNSLCTWYRCQVPGAPGQSPALDSHGASHPTSDGMLCTIPATSTYGSTLPGGSSDEQGLLASSPLCQTLMPTLQILYHRTPYARGGGDGICIFTALGILVLSLLSFIEQTCSRQWSLAGSFIEMAHCLHLLGMPDSICSLSFRHFWP